MTSRRPGAIAPRLSRRTEIVLILALALAVRLVGFTRPYISQHWIKQLQIAPIALNFYEKGYNILWPETDYSADQPSYIEIEFQLVTFLTALLYKVFGVHEWVGRLVTVSFSMAGMWLLFLLMRAVLGYRAAAFGLLWYAFAPTSVYFSRVLMSEPLMLFFVIATVYSFYMYVRTLAPRYWATSLVSAMGAFLVKLPTVHITIPLLYLAHRRYGWSLFRRMELWALALLALAPAAAYYWHAHAHIGPYYFTVGVGFGGKMWFSPKHFLTPATYALMTERLVVQHLTAVGLVMLLLGIFYQRKRHKLNLFHWWLAAVLLYFVVVSGGNLRQSYYQLPLLPAAAGLIGIGWGWLARSRRIAPGGKSALVVAFLVLCVWGARPMYKEFSDILKAAQVLDGLDPQKQPVIIMPPGYGVLYYFNRPGWVGREDMGKPPSWVKNPADIPGPLYIEDRIRRGARWAVYFKGAGQSARPDIERYLREHFAVVHETPGFVIFDLSRRLSGQRKRAAPAAPSPGGEEPRATQQSSVAE